MDIKKLHFWRKEKEDGEEKRKLAQVRLGAASSPKPTGVDLARRSFLESIVALGVLAGLPAALEGCDFYYLDQNFDIEGVEPLAKKGPVIEIENLTTEKEYVVLEREWGKRNLQLDPRKLIQFPGEAGQEWQWAADKATIRELVKEAGYTVIDTDEMNGKMNLSIQDKAGNFFGIYFTGSGGDFELNVMGQNGDKKDTHFELHSAIIPPAANPFLGMYEYRGGSTKQISEFGFPEGTAVVEEGTALPFAVSLPSGKVSIDSKEQFWAVLQSKIKSGNLLLMLLLEAPSDFLKPGDLGDLEKIISVLPSNDPLYFLTMIRKLVTYQKDASLSQEYKAPMQTINDGWGDCDDYAMLNGYWGKLNGFMVEFTRWSGGFSGQDDHVTVLLMNIQTGERFLCDNYLVNRGADVDKMLDYYRSEYSGEDSKSV